MTQQELQQAFINNFTTEKNIRTFWNGDLRMMVELNRGMWGDKHEFRVEIDELDENGEEETNSYTWTEQELLARLNDAEWVMDDLTDAQKEDLELQVLPEVDPISETTYTTKSGYTMNMFLVQYDTDKKLWYEIDKAVKAMRGWYDKSKDGYMMRSRQDAERLLNVMNEGGF